jgi:predicted RNA-binding Zn ribbon-like protein
MSGASTPVFELSGGTLCLDFANTWEDRERPETERLHAYPDLVTFARQAGALEPPAASVLLELAARAPARSAEAFADARRFREVLYRIFSALAAGRQPGVEEVRRLNALLPEALSRLRIRPQDGGFSWRTLASPDPAAPLWAIVHSAAELLTGGDLGRIRECDGARCTWLFLDRSRNRSRRWCSMQTCGNRAKARRHQRRRQEV